MGSDGSAENEEDCQAGSEPHGHAGTHNLWLVEDHTTVDKDRQARLKTGASYSDPSREDSDSKRHADQQLTALRIQNLEKRRSDSAQDHRDRSGASPPGTGQKRIARLRVFFRHLQEDH